MIKANTLYTNYKGETSERSIGLIMPPYWGSNQWHPEAQWLIDVIDLEKGARRTFAVKDMGPLELICEGSTSQPRKTYEKPSVQSESLWFSEEEKAQ